MASHALFDCALCIAANITDDKDFMLSQDSDAAYKLGLLLTVWKHIVTSNQIYFSVAGNNSTQYKSIDLKYEIPLLKEWMVRQADTNTIPNLGL